MLNKWEALQRSFSKCRLETVCKSTHKKVSDVTLHHNHWEVNAPCYEHHKADLHKWWGCCVYDMESISNTLDDNSGCLPLVDKQGTPSGTRQRFPHEVNEEEDEAKNMTAEGCKHPAKITQRQTFPTSQTSGPVPSWSTTCYQISGLLSRMNVRHTGQHMYRRVHHKVNFTLNFVSMLQTEVLPPHRVCHTAGIRCHQGKHDCLSGGWFWFTPNTTAALLQVTFELLYFLPFSFSLQVHCGLVQWGARSTEFYNAACACDVCCMVSAVWESPWMRALNIKLHCGK